MQKIILDTNVLVSALIQKSFPYFILHDAVLERKVELCLSPDLIAEYHDVLKRDKFKKFQDFVANASWILGDLNQNSTWFEPNLKLTIIKDDNDNRLLELAEVSGANYLITGNTKDFKMSAFKQTKIISPKAYWELFNSL